jgi:HK97 gp10 family phage protein
MADEGFVLNLRMEAAQKEAHDAIFEAEREKFEQAKIDAQSLSPKDTGKNAESIQVRVSRATLKATIFTESGYGGYLEVGTQKMGARPYIYPAVTKNLPGLADAIRVKINTKIPK